MVKTIDLVVDQKAEESEGSRKLDQKHVNERVHACRGVVQDGVKYHASPRLGSARCDFLSAVQVE